MSTEMAIIEQTLLLYAPVPLYANEDGYLLEDQACNGLRLWAENFTYVIVMFPLLDGKAPPSWIPLSSTPIDFGRVEIVALPTAYRLDRFIWHYAATRRKISELIDRARYLSFSIGGLIGDWGAVATLEAFKKKRRFAVWTDRVESEVIREQARSGQTARIRLRSALTHRPLAHWERILIRKATVGLFHGAETYATYAPYAKASEIVHNIHLSDHDRIPPDILAAKIQEAGHGPLRLCYVGRANGMKGHLDWVQVMALLHARGVNFQATWLGDGEGLSDMQAEVARHGLTQHVHLPGFVKDRTSILAALRQAHVFAFCHKTPESPRSLIEALVSGTPIVGYDSAFPRDLISPHGGGVLTPLNDVTALADALENLARNRGQLAQLMGKAASDGLPFNDVAVFKHRSEVIRSYM
jgi:colanic acid/amylovoran biosynthesis glycosyltransferase